MKWSQFDRFEGLIDTYMLPTGEGETRASQTVTAINKLVYKCFNDGDVFDTTNLSTCNDLSSYANWLYWHVRRATPILRGVYNATNRDKYEELLYRLCDAVLDPLYLAALAESPKEDTIYDCDGPFHCDDDIYYDDDDYEEEDYEEEGDDDDEDA